MPFSIIAIVLIIVSSLSAAVIADMREKSAQATLTADELQEMADISLEIEEFVDSMAYQAMVGCCIGDTINESGMVASFKTTLATSLNGTYPLERSGHLVEVDVDSVRLSFLRLAVSDESGTEGKWQGEFVPAYVGLTGTFQVTVWSDKGRLTRNYSVADEVKVPWPLLKDRLQTFDSAVGDGLGELSELTREMLDTLCAYRTLQGWGSSTASDGHSIRDLITEQDATNALYLGLVMLQFKSFRNATPCLGMSTSYMDAQHCWDYVKGFMSLGGSIDPADIFLGMYGYGQIDWREVFSQTLYADMDRIILRWMEHCHIIDTINLAEEAVESIVFTINDIINYATGEDLAEGHFKSWLENKFQEAGVPDALYRYMFVDGPETKVKAPTYTLELTDSEGETFLIDVQGTVEIDFPVVDVMEWGGWGDFHEQYKKGTHEILNKLQDSIAIMAESIGRSMCLPIKSLDLDPTDGKSFFEEVRSLLKEALNNKEEWLRPALTAAERYTSNIDPLVEATEAEFLTEKDDILQRSSSLSSAFRTAAEQLMDNVQASNPDMDMPWEENVLRIEQALATDQGWALTDRIVEEYDSHASQLTAHFLQGLDYRPTVSGHRDSIIAEIIARTGDPLAGLGVVISNDVEDLLDEMSDGMDLRGGVKEIEIPQSDHFILIGDDGRSYQETLNVEVEYPSCDSSGLQLSIADPCSYSGQDGRYPQLHDTDLVKMKWASYQSVWGLYCSGVVGVSISPGGESGAVLPLKLDSDVSLMISQTASATTGHPLAGVNYLNINTISDNLAKVIDEVFRPLRDGIEALSAGVQDIYRLLEGTVERLLDMGTTAIDLLAEAMQVLVEQVQRFIRAAVLGDKASAVETVANILGQQTYQLSIFGVGLTIKLKPKDMAYKEVGVPASITLSFEAGDCSISVTSRLIKGSNGYGFLANATLIGNDWSVFMVVDPFMDVFRHMVEVRGIIDGSCIELAMPEVVSYQKISFALSDIPGVGTLLSSIPTPIPGMKGSVDAGIYVRILTGRTDSVVINEYELNPAGEDYGREWVELYNPTSEAVDLAGWTLETLHGIQEIGSMGKVVIMPRERFTYVFTGQALDNQGSRFPSEECIVLLDSDGRRVDSTPFATDYWNDERTWQRAQDGADRWEFQNGTRGRSNGRDPFSVLDLTPLQDIFITAVIESLNQLSSGPMTMQALSETLTSALLHTAQRLAASLLSKEVEVGAFVEVAAADYSSAAKVGMRMELSLRCGTLGEILGKLGRTAAALVMGFGNPFQTSSDDLLSGEEVWISISTFGSMDLPDMVSVPGVNTKVKCVTSMNANLAMLSVIFGEKGAGWGMECGAAICGIPSGAVPSFNAPAGSIIDVWICKASINDVGT